MGTSRQLWGWAGAAVLAVGAQLWGLYRPVGPPELPVIPQLDKVLHAIGFAVPVAALLLLIAALMPGDRPRRRRWTVLVAAVFAGHAVVSELIQARFYRYRSGDPADVAADWIGIAAGWAGARLVLRTRPWFPARTSGRP